MRCPQCGRQLLKIEVQFRGFVTAFFHDADRYELTQPVAMTSSWGQDSPCLCGSCDWKGVVAEALASFQPAMQEAE